MKRALVTMILGFAMAACGGSDGGGNKSCDIKVGGAHSCYTYTADGLTEDQVKQQCTAGQGTVVSSCPTSGLAGVCTVSKGASAGKVYYYTPYTADQVKQACTIAGGTYSASSDELEGNEAL
jgi:hypothetical protein